jgi:hypothetical protein
MQTITNIPTQSKWKRAFQEAVFELNPVQLQLKLEAAQKAIEDRLGEVSSGSGAVPRELMELRRLTYDSLPGKARATNLKSDNPSSLRCPGRSRRPLRRRFAKPSNERKSRFSVFEGRDSRD